MFFAATPDDVEDPEVASLCTPEKLEKLTRRLTNEKDVGSAPNLAIEVEDQVLPTKKGNVV